MTIAIIGYGSLIWDLDDLAPKVTGPWQVGTGPAMPVEFTRVSPKRKKALALVIEDNLQELSATSHIVSSRNNLKDAKDDLAARERTHLGHIGWATRTGEAQSCSDTLANSVVSWLERSDYSAAVWTDLNGNFHDHTGIHFSHQTGLDYLKNLNDISLQEAWRYITFAPVETDTPFRRFLASNPWWASLPFDDPHPAGKS